MREILTLFWQICQFKKGPQDVAESKQLYYFSVGCYLVFSLLITKMSMNWLMAIINSVMGFMLLLGFVWAVLNFNGKLDRFYPTATALYAVDALITACSLPVFAAVVLKLQPGVAFLFLVLLLIWNWAVMANILRLALSSSIAIGLVLATVFYLGSFQFLQLISEGGQ